MILLFLKQVFFKKKKELPRGAALPVYSNLDFTDLTLLQNPYQICTSSTRHRGLPDSE